MDTTSHLTSAHGEVAAAPVRLWRYATAHHRDLLFASLFSFLNKVFDLAPPLLIGAAVDVVVAREDSFIAALGISDPKSQLVALAIASAIVWILESVFEYLFEVRWRNLAQTVQHELRRDAYDHVQHLEMRYFEDRSTGGLMSVLNDDVNQLERFLNVGANDLIQVSTTVVVVGFAFFVIDPAVAWLGFLPIPMVIWGSLRFQRAIAPKYAEVREQVGLLNSQLSNNLSGIATIKSFTAEDIEVERIAAESDAYRQSNRSAIVLASLFTPLIRMAILVGFLGILVYGGFRAVDGALAVGAYSVMVYLTQRLLWPLTRLGETIDLYQRAMASVARVLNVMDTPAAIVSGDVHLAAVAGELRIDGVTFAYDAGFDIVAGLDLDFPAGETTAIVGPTGSGKTTVIKLLLRFYDPQAGAVRLDGHDVRDLQLADLRGAIGLVSQDVFLFHGTVRENIAYGRPGASDVEVVAAAEVAEADVFIRALPKGYDTIVGERGQKLSGGQRQRISLARAVLKDPPVLLLDEATSAVDNETEAAIQRSLERIAVGRTTIVIAHRLSTVRHAHRIHVLDAGRVVEAGTHDELVARRGAYAALWDVQTGEAASHA